ncbi:MAG: hypothetical protein ABI927_04065, partial [Gaiellaceae bacterium]
RLGRTARDARRLECLRRASMGVGLCLWIALYFLLKALRIDTSRVENVLPASVQSPGLRQA